VRALYDDYNQIAEMTEENEVSTTMVKMELELRQKRELEEAAEEAALAEEREKDLKGGVSAITKKHKALDALIQQSKVSNSAFLRRMN
jgi:hypothetical protein